MSFILTTASVLKCSHGGVVRPAASQALLKIGDDTVLVQGDLDVAAVDGCPTPNSSSSKQCTKVMTVAGGVSAVLSADGKPALTSDVQGTTDGHVSGVVGTWVVDPSHPTRITEG